MSEDPIAKSRRRLLKFCWHVFSFEIHSIYFCSRSVLCSILCLKCLLNVLRHHLVYKDVFREVGMLEVMVTCLHRYAALLKEPQNGTGRYRATWNLSMLICWQICEMSESVLGFCMMIFLWNWKPQVLKFYDNWSQSLLVREPCMD